MIFTLFIFVFWFEWNVIIMYIHIISIGIENWKKHIKNVFQQTNYTQQQVTLFVWYITRRSTLHN